MHLGDYFTRGRVPHEDRRVTCRDFSGLVPKKRYCDAPVFANFLPVATRYRSRQMKVFRRSCTFPQHSIPVPDFLDWEFAGQWSINRKQQTRFVYPNQTTDHRLTIYFADDEDALMCIMRDLFTSEQCYPRGGYFG